MLGSEAAGPYKVKCFAKHIQAHYAAVSTSPVINAFTRSVLQPFTIVYVTWHKVVGCLGKMCS